MKRHYRDWLGEVTAIPTATGCEHRIAAWVEAWARARKHVVLKEDKFGNLLLQRRGARSLSPIIFTAHMDHPAFVVTEVIDGTRVEAEFRGGVADGYFVSGQPRVVLHHDDGSETAGSVAAFRPAAGTAFKGARIELDDAVDVQVGSPVTWLLPTPRFDEAADRFHAPVCDDLAGMVAGLAAFDALLRTGKTPRPDVRLLLTRAEEVGFIGAIGACKSGIIPKRARLINLECSRSLPNAPVGEGVIVRVGDRMSTFDPALTGRIGQIADQLVQTDSAFRYQRRLMDGGRCEASAFLAYGYAATGICLPLGNYHNMNETTGLIDAEFISIGDFTGMIRLLTAIGRQLDRSDDSTATRKQLDKLFARHRALLD